MKPSSRPAGLSTFSRVVADLSASVLLVSISFQRLGADWELHFAPRRRRLAPSSRLEYHGFSGSKSMQVETTKKLFTVDDYYRMLDAGILTSEDRVELIDGEIFQMSPIGSRHLGCVNRATRLFTSAF